MTSPVSMPAGHAIVAADLDAYENLTGDWVSYTPVWSASGVAPAIGNGGIIGKYLRFGKTCATSGYVVFGTTSTYGTGTYGFTLPFTSNSGGVLEWIGSSIILDAGTTRYTASCHVQPGDSVLNIVVGSLNQISNTSPITFTTSDRIGWSLLYEVA